MADNAEKSPEKKGSGTLKAAIIVALVVIVEVVTVFVTMKMYGGPQAASGQIVDPQQLELNKVVEVFVLKEKFWNDRSGKPNLYDTEIYVNARKANQDTVQRILEEQQAAISVDLNAVFARAEPAIFREPTHATLSRQIKSVLDERFGVDADGEPIIMKVLIRKCIQYPAHY